MITTVRAGLLYTVVPPRDPASISPLTGGGYRLPRPRLEIVHV